MFTGLIEKKGIVKRLDITSNGGRIEFYCKFSDSVKNGSSVAINGVCLTVENRGTDIFSADIMKETLNLTNLKFLKSGDIVNVERAMKINDRFDGHIVQGHTDTTSSVENIIQDGFSKILTLKCNTELIVLKGSVAINGVSLTVCDVTPDEFKVSLIPSTLNETNLDNLKIGDIVNIEYDITGKYFKKFSENSISNKKTKITEEFLRENGF